MLLPYKTNQPDNLGQPERYFIAIMDMPKLQLRLEAWYFQRTFEQKFEEARLSVESVALACSQVEGSTKLKRVRNAPIAPISLMSHTESCSPPLSSPFLGLCLLFLVLSFHCPSLALTLSLPILSFAIVLSASLPSHLSLSSFPLFDFAFYPCSFPVSLSLCPPTLPLTL